MITRWLIAVALLFSFSVSSFAQRNTLPAAIADALKSAGVPAAAMGIVVMEPSGRIVFAHNPDESMNPASVMKLVTTYAALETLGPSYTWRTEIFTTGTLDANGKLDGDLIIKGYGDPRFTIENFWMLLRDLRARGVRDIKGDLVLDRSALQTQEIDPAEFDGEPTRPYNVGPDALLVNFKAVRLTFVPDAATQSVRILMEPPLPEVKIGNNLTLTNGSCEYWPEKPDADLTLFTLTFNGNYSLSCGDKVKYFSLLPPAEYTRSIFDHLWRGMGGSFSGRVRNGTAPENMKPIVSFDSPTLLEIVRDINKNSNNVMARMLFLALGTRDTTPGNAEASRAAVTQWLRDKRFGFPELVLENGSGLSRVERVSPRNLARLLANAWISPMMPEYVSSLPIAAVDGTLKRRFRSSEVAGRAHLKTGFLQNVRAIAGYVHGENGRTLILVSLMNHSGARDASNVQDAVVEWAFTLTQPRGCCGKR